MPLVLKIGIILLVALTEVIMGRLLWRRFMSEGKPQIATFMAAQAAATVVFVGFILFILLD